MNELLDGIRVVEMGTHIAIPKAARTMADWGAQVIKVEPPHGEAWRTIGKEWDMPCEPDNNPLFQVENANKQSIVVDLKQPRGREIFLELLETADIFMTSTRSRALKKLGLDYNSLKSHFPNLIYVHFSAYGDTGPDRDMPGFDSAAYWARSGALLEWSQTGQEPFRPFPGFGDSTCSGYILSGVLAALVQKLRTGKGEFVKLSLYGTALWFNSIGLIMGQPQYGKTYPVEPERLPNAFTPYYQTADGDWIVTGTSTYSLHAPAVFRLLGMKQYADNPYYTELAQSRSHLTEVIGLLRKGYGQTSTQIVLEGLTEIGLVHAKVSNPREVCSDEQAWANGYLRQVELECGDTVVLPNSPVQFGSVDAFDYQLGPQLGGDTKVILQELGHSEADIAKLISAGCVAVQADTTVENGK